MAATPRLARTPKTPDHVSAGRPRLRVRWDRVSVLVALVAVLATVIAHSMIVAVRNNLKSVDAEPAATNVAAAPSVDPQPKCPRPMPGVVRTATVIQSEGGEAQRTVAQPTVALTFDDGPGRSTPEVLDVLHQNGVLATFFVVGQNAAAEPEMLQRIVADGHAIGDHTWSHPIPSAKAGWKASTLAKQISRTRRAIVDATGREPCLFRPPGGIIKGAERVAHAAGLSVILWSVDTRDWAAPPSTKFASVIQKRAAVGLKEEHPVILLHDGGNRVATVAALPGIINDYRTHGYRFVTLDQLG